MFIRLRRQSWFVFLMAFVMGWSSIALASAKPAHAQMMYDIQVQQTLNAVAAMPDCHTAVQMQHGQHDSNHQQQMNMPSCHTTDSSAKGSLPNCNDCAQLHCQALTVVSGSEYFSVPVAADFSASSSLYFAYTAQHLSGHWQEILRPPKA